MGKTKVVHFKKSPYDIYIARPSKWGNPFSHKEDTIAKYKTQTRAESMERYEDYILNGEGKHLLDDLHELDGKILGCWCKDENGNGKKCHGDILVDLIRKSKQIKLF